MTGDLDLHRFEDDGGAVAAKPAIKPATVRQRLAVALKAYIAARRLTSGLAAAEAGLPSRRGWDGIKARPIPAEAYLAFAELLGLDPATMTLPPADMPWRRGSISWPFVAASIAGRMLVDKMTTRTVGKAAGVSAATVSRAAQARALSADSLLALASWCDRHPHEWCVAERMFHDKPALKQAPSRREEETRHADAR